MTTRPTITPLPPTPSRQEPDTFSDKADTFLNALPDFATDLDDLGDYLEETADDAALSATSSATSATSAATSATSAASSESNSAASATAAALTANAGAWAAGNYSQNDSAISQVDFQTYRAKTTHVSATDPANDPTNWERLGGGAGAAIALTGATPTADLGQGELFHMTLAVDTSLSITGAAAADSVSKIALEVVGGGVVNGYLVASGSYDSVGFGTSTPGANVWGFAINPAGDRFFASNIGVVGQYTLSTPGDISTASYDSVSLSVSAQSSSMYSLVVNDEGTKMYLAANNGTIYQYTMSTAWDLSTASYDSKTFSTATQTGSNVYGFNIDKTGTRLYVTADGSHTIYQYTLSTAWDISTASYDSKSFSLSGQLSWPLEPTLNADGTKLFVGCRINRRVYQYSLSTAWDISTASYDNISLQVTFTSFWGSSVFSPDGTKLYVGNSSNYFYQYSTDETNLYTLTYPAGSEFPGGVAPSALTIGEKSVIEGYSRDGGTTFIFTETGRDYS